LKLGDGDGQEFCSLGTNTSRPIFWLGVGPNRMTLPEYDGKLENRIAPIHLAFELHMLTEELWPGWSIAVW
jgi:hypothetical protein